MSDNWGYVIAGYVITGATLVGYAVSVRVRGAPAPGDCWQTMSASKGIRWRYVTVALVCAGAVVWMIVLMQRNVIFFYPVSQAVTRNSHHTTHRLRIGGAVVPRSIKEHGDGVDFELTDNDVTVLVHHTGGEPPLFKDCAPVVAEGHWSAPDSMTFDSTRLLIKHGSDYRAPKDAKGQCPKEPFPREGCQLGFGLLTIGTVGALLGMVTIAAGLFTKRPRLLAIGRRYVVVVLVAAIGAFVVMESALFGHDYSLQFVVDNVARATPGLYTFTAAWSALEGSILLWGLLLSIYVAVTAWHFRRRATDPIVAWATLVQYGVLLFFFALMLVAANPFKEVTGAIPLDGRGPNPLLQNHPLVAIHPPMLYAGYVGFTIPFSFAIAALVTARFGEGWLADVRRTTLVAWGFLTVGIVLGAWWSYAVLGWGGYWGWDPVENASLLPWLTATAFIHSLMVQERRGMLRVWNLSLVIATFCLTILGTFLTRSGVVNSVHAFSESSIGSWLLIFLGVCAFGGVALIAWRGDKLRAPGRIDSPLSREAAFLLNNLLFAAFALVVLAGTAYPLLVEALQDKQVTVGQPYFVRLAAPIGLALLFLMAVRPALPWRAATGELLRHRLLIPAWAGAIALVVALLAGAHGIANVLAFSLAAFTLASIGRSMTLGVRARCRAAHEALPTATVRTVQGNPRLYGGLLVHVGVVVIAVGLATTAGYTTRREVQLVPGQTAHVRGYTLTYLGREVDRSAQKTTIKARIRVNGIGELAPAISTYPTFADGIGTPSIHTDPLHDLYLTLISAPTSNRITLGVQIGTLVMWLWIGGLIMALGTIVALVPQRRRVIVRRSSGEPEPELVEVGS